MDFCKMLEFIKVVSCCCVLLFSLNGCIHLIVFKSMLDIVGIHKLNELEKEVDKLKGKEE